MDKREVIISVFIAVLMLSLIVIKADVFEPIEKVDEEIKSFEQDRADYLKQEWTKILNNSKAGEYMQKTEVFMEKIDPFTFMIFGLKFSWSWLFFTTVLIAIFLLDLSTIIFEIGALIILTIFAGARQSWKKTTNLVKRFVFLLFILVLFWIRAPKFLANFVITFISGKGEWWVQLIIVIAIFFGTILLMVFSKQISKFLHKIVLLKAVQRSSLQSEKNKEKLEELEQAQEEAEESGDVARISKANKRLDAFYEEMAALSDQVKTYDVDTSYLENVNTDYLKEVTEEDKEKTKPKWWEFWKAR